MLTIFNVSNNKISKYGVIKVWRYQRANHKH